MSLYTRRSILKAIPALLCAPAIVKVANIMPVKAFDKRVWQTLEYGTDPSLAFTGFIPPFSGAHLFPGGLTYVAEDDGSPTFYYGPLPDRQLQAKRPEREWFKLKPISLDNPADA